MTQQTKSEYPKIGTILALVGGILIMLGGVLFLGLSAFILPNLDYRNVTTPPNLPHSALPKLISGIFGVMGTFGLISGIIVLISALMILTQSSTSRNWGILILVFSILSFLGLGGFIAGAVLGILGGILTLRWKPPTPQGHP